MKTSELLESFRAIVETIAPAASPARRFRRYAGEQPFSAAAASSYECFHVSLDAFAYGEGFSDSRNLRLRVRVDIGHPAMGTEAKREDHLADDIERIADVVEDSSSFPSGVDSVLFSSPALTDRSNPQAWVSTLFFDCSIWGPSAGA